MLIINGWLSGEEKRDGLAKILFSIDILTKFTDKFWKIFANELNMVFGYDVFESHSKKDIDKNLCYIAGTAGWVKAFMKTCRAFGLNDVAEYYYTLEWYDSDAFDNEICSLLEMNYEIEEIK